MVNLYEQVCVAVYWLDAYCDVNDIHFHCRRCEVPVVLESLFPEIRSKEDFLCFHGVSVTADVPGE